jgi:hypothetical protein
MLDAGGNTSRNTQTAETGSPSLPRSKYPGYVGWAMVLAVGVSFAAFAIRTVIDVRHEEECRANLHRIAVALQNWASASACKCQAGHSPC